jgi:RND family efflux transporter MFP subunit
MNAVLKRHWGKIVLLIVLAAALAAVPFVMLPGHSAEATTIYHCPMHPTYTSDRPGDCPICGMRLVPVPGSGGTATGTAASPPATGSGPGTAAPAHSTASGDLYVCPMHPEVQQHGPGRCPKCGMDLVKADPQPAAQASAAVAGMATVHATADQFALAGVRTTEALTGVISNTVRAVGNVVTDETRVRQVTTKIGGWIEKLHVNAVGQFVRAGDPLFDLYSPELLASQQEYLRARATAAEFEQSSMPEVRRGGQDLVSAGRRRLELFDVPQAFLDQLERTGAVQRTITFRAPFSGYVTEKTVLEGQRIDSGMPLMTLSDLSRVWVIAQVYENEAAAAAPGRAATLSPQYDNTVRLPGRVSLVYPTMDVESRTVRVRFEVANPKMALKPGMFVNVELETGQARGVIVPDSAVIDTGTRQVVFVKAAGGQFEPREVAAGARAAGRVLIKTGLKAGEVVAVAANFLLDSESRLRAAIGAAAPAAGHDQHK